MSDYMIRATAADHQLRAFAATTREMVEEGRKIHNTSPVMTAALGRLLTAGCMMGVMLKGDKDVLTLQIKGAGAGKGVTVTADSKGNVKGYVIEPVVVLPPNAKGKLDVAGAIGPGYLRVIKDMGLKEPYIGQTELQTSEIAEDLTYYFATSEQVPSSVGLGVLMEKDNTVKQAGGFIVQLMPFTEDAVIDKLEANLSKVTSVTSMLDAGMNPEQMLEYLLEGLDPVIVDSMPCAYTCNCTRERVEKAIISVGKADIESMINDGEPIEVNCDFCDKHYEFSVDDLRRMYRKATN
jgi:molecular chaperone Hsp33